MIDVGVRRRLFSGATRRAVEVRDRFCTGFGCDEPASRCDVDHVVPYAAGGLTVQANGRVACPAHNPGRRKRRARPSGPDPPE
ncbi:MAG: HNH endonuclease [Actinobacteria bacterium]|nr:HNH endonuclease [Actinomycetota bacterium]